MRYSLVAKNRDIIDDLKILGATNIVWKLGIAFFDAEGNALARISQKFPINPVQTIKPASISVPTQISSTADNTVGDFFDLLGLNNFKLAVTPPLSGSGLTIGMLDTGVLITHTMLGGKVTEVEDFTGEGTNDDFNHGTGVASIIHAAAPNANIVCFKVIGANGNGTEEALVTAISRVIQRGDINVLNVSVGSSDDGNVSNPIRIAIRALIDTGIPVIAAAGNNGPNEKTIMSPAVERDVIAVGSCSINPFLVNDFSSRGPTQEGLIKPDTTFFGDNIILASSAGISATKSNSGTSFTSPMVTGLVALIEEYSIRKGTGLITGPGLQTLWLPVSCTKPDGTIGDKDNDYGYGAPFGQLIINSSNPSFLNIDVNKTLAISMAFTLLNVMSRM